MSDGTILNRTHIAETFRADGPVRSYKGQTTEGQNVSIKVVETSASEAEAALKRLGSLQGLQAPGLERILESGLTEDGYYIVREWVDGTHLGVSPLPAELTREKLAAAVADAVAAMGAIHALGLTHGDVRPSNIVVAPDGTTKLIDALIPAAPVGHGHDAPETAYYTSPEEIAGETPTSATDIYRSGLVLYELLAGRPPFAGTDAEAVLEGQRGQMPTPPSTLEMQPPSKLDAVVDRALGKAPQDRFSSAGEMVVAIRGAIAESKPRMWLWIAIAAVAAVIVLGALAAWWFLGRVPTVAVPQIVGMQQTDAAGALTKAGFKAGKVSQEQTLGVAAGTVTTQTPPPAAQAPKGSAVAYTVAVVPQVAVPNVAGLTQDDATTQLAQVGLRLGTVSYVNDTKAKPGYVMSQNPAGGTDATIGVPVTLTVSKGPKQGQVPNVVGLSESDAQSTLQGAGFKSSSTKASSGSVAAGNLISQSPAAGTVAAAGRSVTISVSTGAPGTPKVSVPNVVGLGILEAIGALRDAKLKIGFQFVADDRNILKIAAQNPVAATQVDQGTKVTISIGLPSFSMQQSEQLPAPAPAPAPAPSPAPTLSPVPTTTPGTVTP